MALGCLVFVADAQPQGRGSRGRCAWTPAATAERAPLDAAQQRVIVEALQDEYRGEAVYARVVEDLGDIRPFSNIVHAERRHSAYLEDLGDETCRQVSRT